MNCILEKKRYTVIKIRVINKDIFILGSICMFKSPQMISCNEIRKRVLSVFKLFTYKLITNSPYSLNEFWVGRIDFYFLSKFSNMYHNGIVIFYIIIVPHISEELCFVNTCPGFEVKNFNSSSSFPVKLISSLFV